MRILMFIQEKADEEYRERTKNRPPPGLDEEDVDFIENQVCYLTIGLYC